MRTTQEVIERMKNSPIVNKHHLTKEEINEFIETYQTVALQVLLDNGYVRLSEDLNVYLIKLKDRRYVLRGNSYSNHRKFKLKMSMGESVYKKILENYGWLLGE